MSGDLEKIERGARNFENPPLERWHPPLSGDIAIRIAADGQWYHEGDPIRRESLVRLFASILRREEDGEYYLVTPAEKWRVEVEQHPLQVVDIDRHEEGGETILVATLNTGRQVSVDAQNTLFLEPDVGDVAAMHLPHGLTALFARPAWYRLVELAETVDGRLVVRSAGRQFDLSAQGASRA